MILVGGACVVVTLSYLPLSTAHVVFYTTPIFTLLIALWLFNEAVQKHRIINVMLCFVGVLIALKPNDFGWGVTAGIAASLCVAVYNLTTRIIPSHISSMSVFYWSTACSLPLLGLLSLTDWQPFTKELWYLIFGSAISLGIYQITCVFAYRKAEAGGIVIAEYSGLIFALALGWWFFGENIDSTMLLGITFIIGPMLWQTRIEHNASKIKDAE
ncbi:DMT family transporter [Alteromonas sp. a30]|nr:DMT family transporter [Alteromonas sp. a30]